jgi:hypothetical protein
MTARLVCGLFCGVFTFFFAAVSFGLIISSPMLSEVSMLLVGYVYFVTMGVFSLFRQDFLRVLESQESNCEDDEVFFELYYPRLEVGAGANGGESIK